MKFVRLLAAAIVLLAVASGCVGPPRTTTSAVVAKPAAAAHADCEMSIAGSEELLVPGRIVLVGELHGTTEVPRIVGELVCIAAKRGAVVLAVEFPVEEQPRLTAFLESSAATPAALRDLVSSAFWSKSFQDGRTSVAMARLLARARELKRAGATIQIRAFAPSAPNGDQGEYEKKMAQQLTEGLSSTSAISIILAGNLHAQTTKGTDWDPDFTPAGYFLAKSRTVTSLLAVSPGGSAWVCTGPEHQCGPHSFEWPGKYSVKPGIEWSDERSGFDGLLHVGPIHASSPAAKSGGSE